MRETASLCVLFLLLAFVLSGGRRGAALLLLRASGSWLTLRALISSCCRLNRCKSVRERGGGQGQVYADDVTVCIFIEEWHKGGRSGGLGASLLARGFGFAALLEPCESRLLLLLLSLLNFHWGHLVCFVRTVWFWFGRTNGLRWHMSNLE